MTQTSAPTTEAPTTLRAAIDRIYQKAYRDAELLRQLSERLGDDFDYSRAHPNTAYVDLHPFGANTTSDLRFLRRRADGRIRLGSIYPNDDHSAHVSYELVINGVRIVYHGRVADYRPLIRPGANCRREPMSMRIVCEAAP